jgi:long-chain fatty acid transport protein
MGMAGAFTAQADDGSALFHNVAGIAFQKSSFTVGATLITSQEATFQGANPFPGTGARAEQKTLMETPPHMYYVRPMGDRLSFGFGVTAPFGLTTEWDKPGQFSGRYLSTKAALRSFDLMPSLAYKVTPNFAVGFSAVARSSDVELARYVPQVNPFTLRIADIGRIGVQADFSEGYGFNAGFLHRINNSFSWGFSYRSKIKVDYEGEGQLTQILTGNPQFDGLVASRLPFGRALPVKTSIEFPDMASLGVALAITPRVFLETDANWTGWSSFDEVVLDFTGDATNSLPDSTIPEGWEDVMNYRIGVRWAPGPTREWRFGYVMDKTPQPEEVISPLLPDADRTGITLGVGLKGNRMKTDLALMYLPFDERSRAKSLPGDGDFFGTYKTTAWLLAATVSF